MGKVIIHPGQMKSSTTFVQGILSANREKLLDQGVIYPGPRNNQQYACYGIAGSDIPWIRDPDLYKGRAERLLKEISEKRKDFDILVSAEALASMSWQGVEKFVNEIGGIDHVIFTLRSLHKTLPSAWQQTLKKGSTQSISEYFERLERTRDQRSGPWRTYAYSDNVESWSRFGKVTCIMLPESGGDHTLPWLLFSEALGLKNCSSFSIPGEKANSSMSMESSQILRCIATIVKDSGGSPKEFCQSYYNNFILGSTLAGKRVLPPSGYKNMLSAWELDEWNKLRRLGVRILGSTDLGAYQGRWLESEDEYRKLPPLGIQAAQNYINFVNSNSHKTTK